MIPDKKLPPGVMPRFIWDENRAAALYDAIWRYRNAGWDPLPEWIEEYEEIRGRLLDRGRA